ncbi:MAG TPA: cupin domain-containing protein [Candidatus Tectomicrobia bacterium]|jgi:quercetin dioxygenase-like cupin family protein
MGNTRIKKVKASYSPTGQMGQQYLVSGAHVAMRLLEEMPPGAAKPPTRRDYETVGYVLKGRAELHLEEQKVMLEPGDVWLVPPGTAHTYHILESFTAIEATHTPTHVHGQDKI